MIVLIVVGIIFALIGIPILVGIYEYRKWMEDTYHKVFEQKIIKDFDMIVSAIGWGLIGFCLLLFLIGISVRTRKIIIIKRK